MVILFVKPTETECAIILAFKRDEKVYIHDAFIFTGTHEYEKHILDCIKNESDEYPISKVVFDASVFSSEGRYLRSSLDLDVSIYVNKKKFEYRALNQLVDIKKMIFRKTQTENYARFMNVLGSYINEYNIAIDILADVIRYFNYRVNE